MTLFNGTELNKLFLTEFGGLEIILHSNIDHSLNIFVPVALLLSLLYLGGNINSCLQCCSYGNRKSSVRRAL